MNKLDQAAGFTLIELLTSLTIIAILTAIAVPQFSDYRKRAFDTRAESDLRNVAIAEEAYFLDAERYLSCQQQTCTALPGIAKLSDGVTLTITAQANSFTGTATHPLGSGTTLQWDSENGGLQG